jgi:4-amino-4-deoxy-L-arabinose transferase-like glycosyltransferase
MARRCRGACAPLLFLVTAIKIIVGRLSRSSFRVRIPYLAGVVALLCAAAWLRWQYIIRVQAYPDEFVTLLAVKMILQKGLPVLPSGLLYEHGMLFSYAGALTSALAGFSREAVRVASLLCGLLSIWLTWRAGRRWFSPAAGLVAAAVVAVAPSAVLWGGRARMYTLLQVWVLLTTTLALAGATSGQARWRWLALLSFLGAILTHFVSVALVFPLLVGMVLAGWLRPRALGQRPWLRNRSIWLEAAGWASVVLVGFLVKRLGQPKSIAPLDASGGGLITGIGQVVAIYGALPADLGESCRAVAGFFTAPEALWLSVLALVAVGWSLWRLVARRVGKTSEVSRSLAALFLAWLLGSTTLEMVLLVAPERRDDKYLVMLLPLLALLAADGLTRLGGWLYHTTHPRCANGEGEGSHGGLPLLAALVACLVIVVASWPADAALLERSGPDYDAAFAYVRDHWREGDAVLTGTPAAAAIYLGRNDYYAMQDPGYAYRLLHQGGLPVDRWTGSPWLTTDEQLQSALSTPRRVWLVLERWGLTKEYYAPLTMQRLIAMTDFVREDNGIIVLRSRPGAVLIPESPPQAASVNFDHQVMLLGYAIQRPSGNASDALELLLYWQAQAQLGEDYTVFVHLRDGTGRTLAQSDHLPLAPVYPPTLWPPGQTVRERSVLALPVELPAGEYGLWVGLYRVDTLERLPIIGDTSGENAALLTVLRLP